MTAPVLEARGVSRDYVLGGAFRKRRVLQAVRRVSFSLQAGETLAIVGESGSGKSTLARILTMIDSPTAGEVLIGGRKVDARTSGAGKWRNVQMVFQDPYSSLNPRRTVGAILDEPLRLNTRDDAGRRRDTVHDMLQKVGLGPAYYQRYPHMLSGGQRQRVAIARALMLRPGIVVLDEPVSALDLSVQAQILNLLADLRETLRLSYVFISHDLSVVKFFADRALVMQKGVVVEENSCDALFRAPQHDYTRTLLKAVPRVDVEAIRRRVAARRASV